jgi:hypothetical protein
MHDFAVWLSRTSLSSAMGQEAWIIPILQSTHILAIAAVMSAVAMIELRLFGMATAFSFEQTIRRFVPLIWIGLAVLLATGAVLVISEPKRTLNGNPAFYLKMAMLIVAIAVTVAFQAAVRRNLGFVRSPARSGWVLQLSALATLALWIAIAVAGRWIAYVQN